MKVGLKILTTSPKKELEERSFADYIEVYHIPGSSADWLRDYDMEYVIHAPHSAHGVNLASEKLQQSSVDAIKQALHTADLLNAKLVVLHLSSTKSQPTEVHIQTLNNSLTQLKDDRIIIENLPYRARYGHYFPYDLATMNKFASKFKGRTCLDFSHAMVSSIALEKDHKKLISDLMKLDVRLFHLCDGKTDVADDLHLPLFDGNFDLDYFKSVIAKSRCKRVTLETKLDIEKQKKEYRWLKK